MKHAASIRYGGQLITADEVGYEDYRHMGLICPHCSGPVFLVAAHQRHLGKGATIDIPAQFRHFKASDPVLVQKCVARVAQFDDQEIEKRASVARNQRLKILQRWFWSILINRAETLRLYLEDPETKETRLLSERLVQPVRELFLKSREKDFDQALEFLLKPFEDDPEITDTRLKRDLTRLTKIDLRLHSAICKEVLKFLQSRSSRHMFDQAIIGSIGLSCHSASSQKALDNGGDIVQIAYIKLLGLLTVIPWADEFNAYGQPQKSQLVSLPG